MGNSVISTITEDPKFDFLSIVPKLSKLYLDDLVETDNSLYNMRNIHPFKENILENGVQQPIIVIELPENKYEILAGHKRILSSKMLVKEGYESFDEIKALIYPIGSLSEAEKMRLKMATNHRREYTPEEKISILDRADALYEQLLTENKKPKGKKYEWVMATTGFGESVARRRSDVLKPERNAKVKVKKEPDLFIVALRNRLQQLLATKVNVKNKSITIRYQDTSDLNRILEICGLLEEGETK